VIYVEGDASAGPGTNSHNIVVDTDSTAGWDSDYNVLTTIHGNIGQWAGVTATTLQEWQQLTIW